MSIKIRKPYDSHKRQSFEFQKPSMTQQNFKKQCDIKHIIDVHDKTGLIQHVNRAKAQYGDFSEVNEYQEAMNLVNNANKSFMSVPAEIRAKFGNDAGRFFEFVTNPANAEELVKMGLAAPSPLPAEPAKPATSEASAEA